MRRRASAGFTLLELMITVAILGIIASIALPSYMKYIRRSKTMEAGMNVRKLFDSSISYFEAEYSDRVGSILPKQFPGSGTIVNPGVTCCLAPASAGGRCSTTSAVWTNQTWQALNFSIHDPYYFQYGYTAAGSDATARFQASAYGDLNCNGVLSTFERAGAVQAGDMTVGGPGLFVVNDVE